MNLARSITKSYVQVLLYTERTMSLTVPIWNILVKAPRFICFVRTSLSLEPTGQQVYLKHMPSTAEVS